MSSNEELRERVACLEAQLASIYSLLRGANVAGLSDPGEMA